MRDSGDRPGYSGVPGGAGGVGQVGLWWWDDGGMVAELAESAYGGGGTLTMPELEHIFMSYLGVVSVHDHHVSVHFNII